REDLLDRLEEAPFFFPPDIRSDQTREQWAAELIREAAMIHLRQEIPYSVAVQVVDWQDADGERPTVITAEIWVEKSGHRRIVIGKGGAMIREIGKMARKQLEVFMQEKLFLELEVVVRSDWRRGRESLRELGYEPGASGGQDPLMPILARWRPLANLPAPRGRDAMPGVYELADAEKNLVYIGQS